MEQEMNIKDNIINENNKRIESLNLLFVNSEGNVRDSKKEIKKLNKSRNLILFCDEIRVKLKSYMQEW